MGYGDDHYTWKCTNKKCYEGDEWQDKPEEWPAVRTKRQKDAQADVIEDETGDGYCSSCVDMMAGYGYEVYFDAEAIEGGSAMTLKCHNCNRVA